MSVAIRDSGPRQMFALAGEARQVSMRCRPMFPIDISQVPPQVGAGPFSLTSCTGMYVMDWGLAAAIAQLWIFKEGTHDLNILELGAGCGCYTEYYQWLGFRMRAYDGVPNIENLTDGLVATADLSKPQGFPEADWVLSLEVAEHLRPEETETFLNNLVRPAKHGIVLSWASPSTSRLRTAAINSTHPTMKRQTMRSSQPSGSLGCTLTTQRRPGFGIWQGRSAAPTSRRRSWYLYESRIGGK